ncbi:hypothetical protein [Waddlia chondrophila]|nr:hypothetical protein [Waddlia chondrophila]
MPMIDKRVHPNGKVTYRVRGECVECPRKRGLLRTKSRSSG